METWLLSLNRDQMRNKKFMSRSFWWALRWLQSSVGFCSVMLMCTLKLTTEQRTDHRRAALIWITQKHTHSGDKLRQAESPETQKHTHTHTQQRERQWGWSKHLSKWKRDTQKTHRLITRLTDRHRDSTEHQTHAPPCLRRGVWVHYLAWAPALFGWGLRGVSLGSSCWRLHSWRGGRTAKLTGSFWLWGGNETWRTTPPKDKLHFHGNNNQIQQYTHRSSYLRIHFLAWRSG